MGKLNKNPKISVVMPVYNAGSFLVEAVESILNQTSKNLELIVVDDASKDNSLKILKKLAKTDARIKIIHNRKRLGVAASTNEAIKKASGDFIARMDADDISYPKRLESQISYILKNPNTVIVGGQCEIIDKDGNKTGEKNFPLKDEDIRETIFVNVPLQQPAIMVNRRLLPKDFLWYEKGKNLAEELDLLFRLFKYGKAANLDQSVLKYRIHGGNTSLLNPKRTFVFTLKTRIKAVKEYGYKPSLKGVFITLAQSLLVLILPNRLIFPLYALIRGLKTRIVTAIYPERLTLAKVEI